VFPGPSGSHQVLRDLGGGPPGSKGPLGFDGRSFGTMPESLRTLGKSSDFRRSIGCLSPGPSSPGGSVDGALEIVAAKPAFAPMVRTPPERFEGRPAEPAAGSRLPGGSPLEVAVPRHRRGSCRGRGRAENAKKTPPPSCAGALTGSMRRRGPCPPGHCRESDLSNPAPHFLWAATPIVNQVLWLACENYYM